ncbi:MAG: hypothetical protein DRI61_17680, partial [Chloroflexi bacterium]
AFTLIELLVVISIIALLLSILMPSLSKVKEQAKKIVCGSNLRQQGIAFVTYALDNNGKFPHRIHPFHWPHGALSWYHPSFPGINGSPSSNFNDPAFVSGQSGLLKGGYIDDPEFMFCPAAGRSQQNYERFLDGQPNFASTGDVQDIAWFAVIIGYDYWAGYRSNPQDVSLGLITALDQELAKVVAIKSSSSSSTVISTDMIATEGPPLDPDYEAPFLNDWGQNPIHHVTYFNHLSGGKILGGNIVYCDGSVQWESMGGWKKDKDSNGNYERIRLDLPNPVGRNTVFWF